MACTRCERPICPDCMRPASVGFQCPECVPEGSKSVRSARTAFGGCLAGAQGMVTKALIGLNVAVFVLTVLAAGADGVNAMMRTLLGQGLGFPAAPLAGHDPAGARPGPWATDRGRGRRVLPAGHRRVPALRDPPPAAQHVALLLFGGEVERMVGRWRFLAVYLLSGLGGAVAVYVFGAPDGSVAGASGSVFGLFGALFFLFRKLKKDIRGWSRSS